MPSQLTTDLRKLAVDAQRIAHVHSASLQAAQYGFLMSIYRRYIKYAEDDSCGTPGTSETDSGVLQNSHNQ